MQNVIQPKSHFRTVYIAENVLMANGVGWNYIGS